MKRLHTLAKAMLLVNAGALGTIALILVLRLDVSGGSVLDIPAVILGYYCAFLLPVTTVAAIVILCRRSPVRLIGGMLLTLALLFLLANYSLLVLSIRAVRSVYDAQGNVQLDGTGNPMMEVNPEYREFKCAQSRRTILASIIGGVGAAILLADGLRQRPHAKVPSSK